MTSRSKKRNRSMFRCGRESPPLQRARSFSYSPNAHSFTDRRSIMKKLLMLTLAAVSVAGTVSAQSLLRCESTNGRRQECRFEGTPTVQLSQQLSRDECIKGETWGVERNVVWVDRGCRADFALATTNDRDRDTWTNRDRRHRQNRTVTVVCESKDGRRHRCATDSRGEITLARQLSRKS